MAEVEKQQQFGEMNKNMVGDIMQIIKSMEIPADYFALEAAELTCDESAMTGETDSIKKRYL